MPEHRTMAELANVPLEGRRECRPHADFRPPYQPVLQTAPSQRLDSAAGVLGPQDPSTSGHRPCPGEGAIPGAVGCASSWARKVRTLRLALLTLCAAAFVFPAQAAWPDKLLRIVLPVAPGAAADALARNLAAHLATRLGQPEIVDA